MRPLFAVLTLATLLFAPRVRAQEEMVEDRYVRAYNLMLAGDNAAAKGQTAVASAKYQESLAVLGQLQKDYPDWNVKLVKFRSRLFDGQTCRGQDTLNAGIRRGHAKAVEMRLKWEVGKRYVQRVKGEPGHGDQHWECRAEIGDGIYHRHGPRLRSPGGT